MKHITIDAELLRDGDLLHLGGTNYVLVARATAPDGGDIHVTVYDGDQPAGEPTLKYAPADPVELAARDLTPDRRVHRHQQGAMLAAAVDRDIRAARETLTQAADRIGGYLRQLHQSDGFATVYAKRIAEEMTGLANTAGALDALHKAAAYIGRATQ
jgi:hypothetical protein